MQLRFLDENMNNNDYETQIIKSLESMAGRYSGDAIFSDWVECSALAIQNGCSFFHDDLWDKREEQYMNIINKYNKEEQQKLTHMFSLLTKSLETEIKDTLGNIYMSSGCGSKQTGQFFTPFNLALLNAEVGLPEDVSEENKIELNEPSSGGGGMVIAAARVLKERGLNYQNCMKVVAQDLDWRAVYMTYVQLSLLGIDAIVVQGNTLSSPYVRGEFPRDHMLRTPKNMGVLL